MGHEDKVVASNRKARHEYAIELRLEAGIALTGTEVKSLRAGGASLQEAFCTVDDGEVFVRQFHIAPYKFATHFNHEPFRVRRLLLHREEIRKLKKAVQQKGYTIIPLKVYFRDGKAKLEIGVARGKRQYDKRADIAERESALRLKRIQRSGLSE